MNATIRLKEPDETIRLGPGARYEIMSDSVPVLMRVWDSRSGWHLFPASRLVDARFGNHDETTKRESANSA